MSRAVYIVDCGETAFYGAVFQAWKQKDSLITSAPYFQARLDDEIFYVRTEDEHAAEQAQRVQSSLCKIDGGATFEIRRILCSGNPNKEQIAYLYAREIFRYRAPVRGKQQSNAVRAATDVLHKIAIEMDHLKGFIRFKETTFGVYYAACAPDNDILPYLAQHFIRRLAIPFILHDVSRGYALCFNGSTTQKIKAAKADIPISVSEEAFCELWSGYFKNIAIRARINQKQQDRSMPRRYRKFMDETTVPPSEF